MFASRSAANQYSSYSTHLLAWATQIVTSLRCQPMAAAHTADKHRRCLSGVLPGLA